MRVLVVRFSALGDVVLTTGPLRAFINQQANIKVDFLTSEVGAEILQGHLDIDNILIIQKGSSFIELIKQYRKLTSYDTVIDLQSNFKSYLLKFFLSATFFRIKKQSRLRRSFTKTKKGAEKLKSHVTEKYYEVFKKAFDLKDIHTEILRPSLFVKPIVFQPDQFDFSKAVIIHPFASQKNKVWPYFSELIKKLIDQKINVVIVGESSYKIEIPESELIRDLTNKTCLNEMKSIIASGAVLLTSDSGPMHIGIAVKKPVVALFGPTTKEFGFYPIFKDTFVLENKDLSCRPCHVHGGNTCPLKHFDCMKSLSVDRVFNTLKSTLH